MSIFNIYSLPIGCGALLLALLLVVLRRGRRSGELLALGGLAVCMFLGWLVIRPVSTPLDGQALADAAVGQGLPVLIEAQSPY